MRKKIGCLLLSVMISGCASSPDSMLASSVSPLLYQDYDCKQLVMEGDRISRRTQALYATLDSKASTDTVQMTVGLLLLWPTLFFLEGGDGAEAVEYKRLKGEYDAIHQAAIVQKCDMRLMAPPKITLKEDKETEEDKQKKANNCQNYGEC
jgi:hypothetical protein